MIQIYKSQDSQDSQHAQRIFGSIAFVTFYLQPNAQFLSFDLQLITLSISIWQQLVRPTSAVLGWIEKSQP